VSYLDYTMCLAKDWGVSAMRTQTSARARRLLAPCPRVCAFRCFRPRSEL